MLMPAPISKARLGCPRMAPIISDIFYKQKDERLAKNNTIFTCLFASNHTHKKKLKTM